jgi:hypothetical protein
MKRKVVLWGENAANEKILLALELLEKDNKVNIYTFPHAIATEEFSKKLHDEWRDDKEIAFPEGHIKIERPLTMSDSLLPDDIKVDRPDIITMAQAEWHVIVLSNKLYDTYRAELDEIKAKIDSMSEYDDKVWDAMVEFWAKISDQVKERVIFREHASILKDRTNILFGKLKDLKKEVQKQYEIASKEVSSKFFAEVEQIELKISDGLGLKPLFEQLKKMQASFRDADMTRKDKDKVYKKIDDAFKTLKAHKSGGNNSDSRPQNKSGNTGGSALQSRYDGLLGAIRKMDHTVNLDKQEIAFQLKRIDQTDGQLEMQIRQAKMKMIEERLKSKLEKLEDMLKTKIELEDRIKADEFKKAKQVEEGKVKEKIASDIAQAKEARNPIMDKLESAAVAITASIQSKNPKKEIPTEGNAEEQIAKPDEPSMFEVISSIVSETYEDVVDTVKAVAEVVEDRFEDAMEKLEDKSEDVMDSVKDKFEVAKDKAEDVLDKVMDKAKDIKDSVEDKVEDIMDKAETALENAKDKVEDSKDTVEDKVEDIMDKGETAMDNAKDKAEDIKDSVEDKVEDIMDKDEIAMDNAKDKAEDIKDSVEDKVEDIMDKGETAMDNAKDKAEDIKDSVEDKVDDTIKAVKSTVNKEENE